MPYVNPKHAIPCRRCNGSGMVRSGPSRWDVTCPTCNGTGKRQPKPNPNYVGEKEGPQ